jgi:hypothetical protein
MFDHDVVLNVSSCILDHSLIDIIDLCFDLLTEVLTCTY